MLSHKKRVIPMFLAIIILVVSFSACGQGGNTSATTQAPTSTAAATTTEAVSFDPFGKYEPAIDVRSASVLMNASDKLPEGQTYDNSIWTQTYKDELGINVKYDFSVPGEQAKEKMNMVIASGDLPDMFAVSKEQFYQLYNADMLEDLKDVYEKYASTQLKEMMNEDGGRVLNNVLTIKGKLFGLPHANDVHGSTVVMWIRNDWLKNLGLGVPKNFDELKTALEAFTTKDPDGNGKNDTYGLSSNKWFVWHMSGLLFAQGAYPINGDDNIMWLQDANNNLVPEIINPKIKPALLEIKALFDKGTINKDFAAIDMPQTQQDVAAGKAGAFFGGVWADNAMGDNMQKDPNADWICASIPNVSGGSINPVASVSINRVWVVRKGFQYPEAIIKLANSTVKHIFGSESEPQKYHTGPGGEKVWRAAALYVASQDPCYGWHLALKNAISKNDPSVLGNDASAKGYYESIQKFKEGDWSQFWCAYSYASPTSGYGVVESLRNTEGSYVYNSFYGAPTKTMGEKEQIMKDKFIETCVKIIMGSAGADEFDKFVDYWNTQGGKEITKEINDWWKSIQ